MDVMSLFGVIVVVGMFGVIVVFIISDVFSEIEVCWVLDELCLLKRERSFFFKVFMLLILGVLGWVLVFILG